MTASRTRRGRLVALEGIDGVGKSTLARALASALRRRGWSVGLHREPNNPRLGALAQSASVQDPWTGAVYFTIDRHLARPELARLLQRHDVVLADRSLFSPLAYQGSRLPAPDRVRLEALQHRATIPPDRVVLLDLDLGPALARVGGRRRSRGPLERRRTLEIVARAYRQLARRRGWVVLDATRPTRQLVAESLRALSLDRSPGRRRRRPRKTDIRPPAPSWSR